jgi:hypothetical protein
MIFYYKYSIFYCSGAIKKIKILSFDSKSINRLISILLIMSPRKKIQKIIKKDLKTETETESETDTETGTDGEIPIKKEEVSVKPKKVLHKSVTKKNTNNNDLPKLEKLLAEYKYDEIKENIHKYELTSKDIKNIISCDNHKFIKYEYPNYIEYKNKKARATKFIDEILLKIKENGYIFSELDYSFILKKMLYDKELNSTLQKKILENFVFNTIDELIAFFKNKKIAFENNHQNVINLEPYGKDKITENISYLYCSCGAYYSAISYLKNSKIKLTKKHLEYASNNFKYVTHNETVKYILKNMDNVESSCETVNIEKSGIDNEIIKCTSIDNLDEVIHSNNYNITLKTIILGIRNNINIDLVIHMLTYKLEFDEENINQLIVIAKNYAGIERIIIAIKSYGYKFTKQNYIQMLSSPYYYLIFSENIGENFVIDEDIVSTIYNGIICVTKKHCGNARANLKNFLFNLEKYVNDNNFAENMLCLYCASIYILGSETCVIRIKEIRKKYNVKLTKLALTYLYKNKYNLTRSVIKIFKEDGIKPDLEQMKQYISIIAGNSHVSMMMDLFS